MAFYLILLISLVILGAPTGLSFFISHLIAGVVALYGISKLSKFYIFWLLILAACLSGEFRFSVEYLLLATGFLGLATASPWLNASDKSRKIFLGFCFIVFCALDYLKLLFYEQGSLILYLPIWLAIYFHRQQISNLISIMLAGIIVILSNKKTALLGYIATVLNYFKIGHFFLLGKVLFIISIFCSESMHKFWKLSILPRINIFTSIAKASLEKPFTGHGFGTFGIDYPIYRFHGHFFGGKAAQQVVHGHSLFGHILFELGLLGLIITLAFLFWLYSRSRPGFFVFVLIGCCDASLMMFNQYLLLGLIFMPLVAGSNLNRFSSLVFSSINPRLHLGAKLLSLSLALLIFGMSVIGHYYYDRGDFTNAIRWDKLNGLYYFVRGAETINSNIRSAELDLKQAVRLCPSVPYFYGFLAATELANNHLPEARIDIAKAIRYDGADGYWYLLSALINHNDPEIFKSHFKKALKLNPEIQTLIDRPDIPASEYIGSRRNDVRVASFYRAGPRVYLPLPYWN